MAGSTTGFDPAEFRTNIRFAMVMGSPNQAGEKARFFWNKAQTFDPQDAKHRPYRWNQAPVTDTTPPPVVVDNVAIEYSPERAISGTAAGTFAPTRSTLTLLDEDYELVRGADAVEIGGIDWEIITVTVMALFEVDVYQVHAMR